MFVIVSVSRVWNEFDFGKIKINIPMIYGFVSLVFEREIWFLIFRCISLRSKGVSNEKKIVCILWKWIKWVLELKHCCYIYVLSLYARFAREQTQLVLLLWRWAFAFDVPSFGHCFFGCAFFSRLVWLLAFFKHREKWFVSFFFHYHQKIFEWIFFS